jgi:hypothetical protein
MASLLDHQRELLQECGVSIDGLTSSEIADRARTVLGAADRYRLRAEAPVVDEHVSDEFRLKDAEATMHTMAAEPYLTHVPTLTGGTGYEEVRRFYKYHFIPGWPPDVEVTPISRTVGQGRVVDELIVGFTHDREMDAILPGIKPTGRWSYPTRWSWAWRMGRWLTSISTGIRVLLSTNLGYFRKDCRW